MKLHASVALACNMFTACGEGYVAINGRRHDGSLVVTRDAIVPWAAPSFEALAAEHFATLAELGMEILLLGTGPRLRFPDPRLTAALTRARIGVEAMDMPAACRTYNILAAEERKVAAALLHL